MLFLSAVSTIFIFLGLVSAPSKFFYVLLLLLLGLDLIFVLDRANSLWHESGGEYMSVRNTAVIFIGLNLSLYILKVSLIYQGLRKRSILSFAYGVIYFLVYYYALIPIALKMQAVNDLIEFSKQNNMAILVFNLALSALCGGFLLRHYSEAKLRAAK